MAHKTPTYPQYTNLELGDGLLDQLMASVDHHLDKQYDLQRIRGSEYAKVYLGMMEACLQNTTQYLLGTMLINEQKEKLRLEAINLELQGELLELEKEKMEYYIEHILPLEKQKLENEVALLAQQALLIAAQIEKIDAEIILLGKQGLKIDKEIEKLTAEIAFLAAQEAHMLKQAEKIDKEIEFLDAKILSELANTDGTVADPDSLIGKQKSLLSAQKLGFAGDIESKMAKLHADYDAVFQSVQENPADAGLSDPTTTAIGVAATTASNIKSA